MITECERRDYLVGDWFIINGSNKFKDNSIVEIVKDDCDSMPWVRLVKGEATCKNDRCIHTSRLTPVYKTHNKVTITCEGKSVEISRESAVALNLIEE